MKTGSWKTGRMLAVLAWLLTATGCTSGTVAQSSPETSANPASSTLATTTSTAAPLPVLELDASVGFGQLTARFPSGLERLSVGSNDLNVADVGAFELVVIDPATGGELGRSPFRDTDPPTALVRDLPDGLVATEIVHDGTAIAEGQRVTLPDDSPPTSALYDQILDPGFNYLEVRDGTTLSAFVTLPGDPADGPYPTLVEYSGYEPSNPNSNDPTRDIVGIFGYALVQVNVRGTGCSGGSFDAFEPIQRLDGYDVIETVASQQWAGNVGMWGISYPGIMQLHVASSNPPSLAAIAPLSVIDEVESVLYPGGIYNDGFGAAWTEQVSERAQAFGQPWTRDRVDGGDDECASNQGQRIHNPDLVARIRSDPAFDALAHSRSPRVEGIDVPVFLAGGWQDEQTGAGFADLLPRFTSAPVFRAVVYNGLHTDPLGPHSLGRLIEFYDLFVAERSPQLDVITRFTAGAALGAVFGEFLPLTPSSYVGQPIAEAQQAYADDPSIEVLFEVGGTRPNLPVPTFVRSFEQWPPTEAEPRTLYLDGDALDENTPAGRNTTEVITRPDEGRDTTATNLSELWGTSPEWNWPVDPDDRTFTSVPTTEDMVLLGSATVSLVVSVPAPTVDTELEATLSEVAADGSETYIQSGWAQLSVEPDQRVAVRIDILPFGHVLRSGSRLRLTIDSPGGSKPRWTFANAPTPTTVTIHTGTSSLIVPVINGVVVPQGHPACGSLRGQPCRP